MRAFLSLVAFFGALAAADLPSYYVLSLQKCSDGAPFTINGLWPQWDATHVPTYCSGPSLNYTAIAPLMGELGQYWASCPETGHDLRWFLKYNWDKHGKCSGWSEFKYFATGLDTFRAGQWKPHCHSDWTDCKVHVQINGSVPPSPPTPPGPPPPPTPTGTPGPGSLYFVMALQKCTDQSPWSMHGLWPQYTPTTWPSNCPGPAFDMSLLNPLMSQIQQHWETCPDSGKSEEWFLSHEWTKHGTCSGWDEYTYFATAIATFNAGGWRSACQDSWTTCKTPVTINGTGFHPPLFAALTGTTGGKRRIGGDE